MKILFVSHSSVLQYHQQKLEILAAKYGHEIWLATPDYWNEGGVEVKAYRESKNIKYAETTVINPKKGVHLYLNAESIVKKINPDIIHIEEEPYDFPAYQFINAAKKYGKKALFFTWENLRRRHNFLYTWFNNNSIFNADAAIAGNEEARRILAEMNFKKPVEVIPQYGVNLQDFIPKKPKQDRNKFNVAYMGRLTAEKGLAFLVSACAPLKSAVLHLAGAGNMQGVLTGMIKHFGIEDRVKFYGHVEHGAVPEFLSNMDCLVLPSITTGAWKEQFGRVIIEAFAAGVPVIGSNSGEIPNVIGDAGIVFKESNTIELTEAIKAILTDSNKYKECVEKGLIRVRENYTNEIIAGKINGLYRLIL